MNTFQKETFAVVFDIQRGSMVDGPGIRTTVFLKGCPLNCVWCHNPEAIAAEPQTVNTCRGETKTYGKRMSVDEVFEIVLKDKPYYDTSGGGLTVSGGEPMSSFEFTRKLVAKAKAAGIHTALDTTGIGTREQWDKLLPLIDLFLIDYKLTNPELHRKYTGIELSRLLPNILYLAEKGARIRLRCPIIPTINDTDEHFEGINRLAAKISNLDGVDLMPYHDTGNYKNKEIGRTTVLDISPPTSETVRKWKTRILNSDT